MRWGEIVVSKSTLTQESLSKVGCALLVRIWCCDRSHSEWLTPLVIVIPGFQITFPPSRKFGSPVASRKKGRYLPWFLLTYIYKYLSTPRDTGSISFARISAGNSWGTWGVPPRCEDYQWQPQKVFNSRADSATIIKLKSKDFYNVRVVKLALTRKKPCVDCDGREGKEGAERTCDDVQLTLFFFFYLTQL